MSNNTNPFQGLRVEFHILQSFPVTCLNRDDVGAPKTAQVGGTTRARVSSQCWKREVRLALHDLGVVTGVRTKNVADKIGKACASLGASEDQSKSCSEAIAAALSDDTLHFFTTTEALALAEYASSIGFEKAKVNEKDVAKVHKKAFTPALDGLDIALFGRMVAKAPDLDVEAAASFAHAISTHKVANEVEFFTALDDESQVQGSAHMGSLEFNAATYYRYVSLDLGQLYLTLGGNEVFDKAIEAFVKALYIAIPSARQTTQSGACWWDYAKVLVRRGQRLQLSFDKAVKAKGEGFLQPSIEELNIALEKKEKLAGSLFGKIASFTFGEDEDYGVDKLIADLQKATKL